MTFTLRSMRLAICSAWRAGFCAASVTATTSIPYRPSVAVIASTCNAFHGVSNACMAMPALYRPARRRPASSSLTDSTSGDDAGAPAGKPGTGCPVGDSGRGFMSSSELPSPNLSGNGAECRGERQQRDRWDGPSADHPAPVRRSLIQRPSWIKLALALPSTVVSRKPSLFWPLRMVVAIALIAPALLLIYATWQSGRSIDWQATERIDRALDVLQEHALKAFQTVERSIAEIDEVLRDVPDDAIRASEARLLPALQAHPAGAAADRIDLGLRPQRPSACVEHDPPGSPRAEQFGPELLQAQRERDAGTYVSEVVKAKNRRVALLRHERATPDRWSPDVSTA